jgi:hypothetical protein
MKLIDVAFYKVSSRMRGAVDIPIDMLRYDLAFTNPEFPGIVAFPRFATSSGPLGGRVTRARWESFLIKVDPWVVDNDIDEKVRESFRRNPQKWVTYQHPQEKNGPTDFMRLHPFTLARYVTAKEREVNLVEGN